MNKALKKLSAIVLLILMITSISFNTITYAANEIQNSQVRIKQETFQNLTASNGSYDLMITNRRNTSQVYSSAKSARNINSGDASDYDVLLIQDGSGEYYFCMQKGGPLMLYANGGRTLREFYYNKAEYSLSNEQKIVLAYLNASEVKTVGGISLDSNNNRQKLIQYYIWKSNINIGRSVTVPSVYSNVISTLQKFVNGKVTIGKDVLDSNENTITIDGVKYEVKGISAYRYTSQVIYRRDNGKGYIESNYQGGGQEMFSFTSSLNKVGEDKPKIKLSKVDEENNGLKDAVFSLYDNETGKGIFSYRTDDKGYSLDVEVEYDKQYKIKETTAPEGYELTDEYVVVNVKKDKTTYKVYDKSGKEINNSDVWSVVELDDDYEIVLQLIDQKEEIPKYKLKKIDADTKEAIPGVKFEVTGSNVMTENGQSTFVTDGNGYIDLSEYLTEVGDYIDLKEIEAPEGYYVYSDNEIHIEVKKSNGNTKVTGEALVSDDEIQELEGKNEFVVTFENQKEETPPTTPPNTPPTTPPNTPTPPPDVPDTPNPPDEESKKEAYPILMYIKGTAFIDGVEGKESKPDGYFNKENGTDKGYEGIRVELYDEETNQLAVLPTSESLKFEQNNTTINTSNVDFARLEKYGKNTVYTDKDGNFEFYGLNPEKKYYVVFKYNGMRFVEIKTTIETGVNANGYDIKKENSSKAVEIDRDKKIVNVFSEIGTYPYNYKSESKNGYNIAYTQTEVEEQIKNGLSKAGSYEKLYSNLKSYVDESMAYFIEDTLVSAKVSGIGGNLLDEVEKAIKEYNGTVKGNSSVYIYPVVKLHNTPKVDQVGFTKNYGYIVEKYMSDAIYDGYGNISGYTAPYWHAPTYESIGTLTYNENTDGVWSSVKQTYIQKDAELQGKLNQILAQSSSRIRYTSNVTGNWYELLEGYERKEVNNISWAVFDVSSEQYLGKWYKNSKSVSKDDVLNKIKEFIDKKAEEEYMHINLGVQYRPTVNLALINDVVRADVTINKVLGEYVYNKRAANGASFKFGVNESDIRSFYKNLSEGNVAELKKLLENSDLSSVDEYLAYFRTTDIHYSSDIAKTTDGIAPAGGYDDNDNSIYITYKITLKNLSNTIGTVTEVVDYYDSNFEVVKAFDDSKEYEFSNTSMYNDRGAKKQAENGYSAVYIKTGDITLKNGESKDIYLVLKMKDIAKTLTEEVLNSEEGYKTINVSEINGYKTERGYIDIASMPGNIIEDGKGRFLNGKYENDEGKSPTIIFKNPDKEGRTISGIVFEDATTGKWSANSTRQSTADHKLAEGDTPIQGVIVQLIQILENGTEKLSAQTRTMNDGSYKFIHVRPGNYVVRFGYGYNDETVLTSINKVDDEGKQINVVNNKSYNGEGFESTEMKLNTSLGAEGYWYTDSDIESNIRFSDAIDNEARRKEVTNNFATLKNENAEILNSFKDNKVNRKLVTKLKEQASMFATTNVMKLEMEYVGTKNPNTSGTTTTANDDGKYVYEYNITNVDFGVVERSRAKLDITKTVSYITLIDSTGKEITGGTYEDWKNGKIKHIKWILGTNGFVSMEIDNELLNGATLKITYDITVENNSEFGNEISNIEVLDYVSNNLNYSANTVNNDRNLNSSYGWTPVTANDVLNNGLVNKTSATTNNEANKIDISTYQTLLKATFKPGETKKITLEKNLSSEEDSNFEYDNKVEIISSNNTKGRGDYTSIYGNLDPITYTSRQGNLYWDFISGTTTSADHDTLTITENSGFNSIRKAEADSASAEEVTLTVPTGLKILDIPGEYFIFGFTLVSSILIGIMLMRKYKELG